MRLIIVRHAETEHNLAGRFNTLNERLSKTGMKQAEKLAHRLLKEKIDVVYCSDLPRAKETLAPYLKLRKIKVIYSKDLREVDVGMFKGKPLDYYNVWKETAPGKKWLDKHGKGSFWAFPKGENSVDLTRRAAKITNKIIKKEKGKNVLIMTHGKTKIMILVHLLKKNYQTHKKRFKPSNTGISIIKLKDDGNHRALRINDSKHV